MSENITPVNADAVVNAIRYSVRSLATWSDYVTANGVTSETVKDHALALAVLAFPKDAPTQKKDGKRTRFGNAVQAAGNGMRRALETDDDSPESTSTVDYLDRAIKAALAAVDHDLDAKIVAKAIASALAKK